MFAAIMQSLTPAGVRETAVIPLTDKIRVFTRVGGGRGVKGAWSETSPQFEYDEALVGQTTAIQITANDYRDLQFPITPTTLLQKLVRTTVGNDVVQYEKRAFEHYTDLLTEANNNPTSLVKYTKAMQIPLAVAPSINVISTPVSPTLAQVVVDELVEPAPLQEEVFIPIESEATMPEVMAFQSVTKSDGAQAVLVVPEVQPYFGREFDGITEERVYDYARSTQQAVLLTGDAGTGKTSSARNYAATHNLPFVTIECTQQIDQSITQGRFIPTGVGNSTTWKYSQLATAIQQPSVILINELTRMTPKAASLFLRLLQERELLIEPLNEVIKVDDDVLFVADQNTGVGYTGTSRQDNALVDRFNIKLEFHYDTKIESKFIKSPALLQFAQDIRTAAEQNDQYSVPMSTRALINFQAQAQNLGFIFAVNAMMNNYPKSDGEREAIKMRFDADSLTIATELGVDYNDYA